MGAGIYLVWPAFYTDVTDAYRLPRRARLRTDLGGIYFNAFVAVVTLGVWLATGVEALLLLIAVQMLEIVKNLSPVIRADGYHILSDATGVPDLYAHMGPTLKRLLPWKKREPSALKGWARVFVTAWVLIIVPILLAMAFSAILLFPKLAASAWESGSEPRLGGWATRTSSACSASIARLVRARAPGGGRGAARPAAGRLDGQQGVALERGRAAAPARSCSPERPGWWRCSPGPGGRPASTSPCARPTTARW